MREREREKEREREREGRAEEETKAYARFKISTIASLFMYTMSTRNIFVFELTGTSSKHIQLLGCKHRRSLQIHPQGAGQHWAEPQGFQWGRYICPKH